MEGKFRLLLLCLFAAEKLVPTTGTTQRNSSSSTEDQTPSYFFYHQPEYSRDCVEVLSTCSSGNSSGVYAIKPDGYPEVFDVFCDSDGYTVIERRLNGIIGFNRSWEDYASGFGFLSHEFWIGNRRLSYLTNQKRYLLRIEVTLNDRTTLSAVYAGFRISDAYSNYTLVSTGQFSVDDGWGYWGPCSVTCGDGVSRRYRSCADGTACAGDRVEEAGCHEAECPINGSWSSWSDRTDCSVSCGGGQQVRRRTCNNPTPQHGGQNCTGDAEQSQNCGTATCDVRDCQDVYDSGRRDSGVYYINRGTSGSRFQVYCNMSHGGGWTVIQRRMRGSSRQSFNKNWASYKDGFGSRSGGFWIGNEQLYRLTNQKGYELRIDMVNLDHDSYYAQYDSFRINGESDKYRLVDLGTYSGTAGHDAMRIHHDRFFSTPDRDNDGYYRYNCANYFDGGWWYKGESNHCYYNGCVLGYDYYSNRVGYWYNLPGSNYLLYTEMKIRPRSR